MKLLFLANRFPYPPFRGDKLKIFHLATRLAAKGHELHLLTFLENKTDLQHEPLLRKIFAQVHLVKRPKWKGAMNALRGAVNKRPLQVLFFGSQEMQRRVDALVREEQYDAVHVQHLRMSPYMVHHREVPRILDLPDAFSLYWKRRQQAMSGKFKKAFQGEEQQRVYRFEREVLPHFDRVLVCSPEDLSYLESEHHLHNLGLLPNGVDLSAFRSESHDYSSASTLLFTGNMDYAPNVDAVIWFVQEILPKIRARRPDIKFVIAGQRPVKKVQELASDDIRITGFVPDLSTEYRQASLVVAPLRFGAGTQNKVLEAMAMGVPVVCTSVGFAGLGVESGEGAFMQQEADDFAVAVLRLLEDASLREETGKKGQHIIRERFGWDVVADRLEHHFAEVIADR